MKATEIKNLGYSIVPICEEDDYSFTELFHEFTKLNPENINVLAERVAASAIRIVRAAKKTCWATRVIRTRPNAS